MQRTRIAVTALLLLVLGACGSSDGSSAFTVGESRSESADTPTDDDAGEVEETASATESTESESESVETPEPTVAPASEPTAPPTPKPTLTPVPVPPTATPVPTPLPPDPLDDIAVGDCVRGLESVDTLVEVSCDAANAEGRVIRTAASATLTCPNADITITQQVVAASGPVERGFCINRIVTLASLFGDIDRRCEPTELDSGEVASTVCTRRNHTIFFVQLERGLGNRAYLDSFQWDSPPERFGEWSLDDRVCGDVFVGRNDGAVLLVSTFDRAPYAVWHVSTELTVDRLADQLSFSLDRSLCPAA